MTCEIDMPPGCTCRGCREELVPGPREQVFVAWRDRARRAHIDCATTRVEFAR